MYLSIKDRRLEEWVDRHIFLTLTITLMGTQQVQTQYSASSHDSSTIQTDMLLPCERSIYLSIKDRRLEEWVDRHIFLTLTITLMGTQQVQTQFSAFSHVASAIHTDMSIACSPVNGVCICPQTRPSFNFSPFSCYANVTLNIRLNVIYCSPVDG